MRSSAGALQDIRKNARGGHMGEGPSLKSWRLLNWVKMDACSQKKSIKTLVHAWDLDESRGINHSQAGARPRAAAAAPAAATRPAGGLHVLLDALPQQVLDHLASGVERQDLPAAGQPAAASWHSARSVAQQEHAGQLEARQPCGTAVLLQQQTIHAAATRPHAVATVCRCAAATSRAATAAGTASVGRSLQPHRHRSQLLQCARLALPALLLPQSGLSCQQAAIHAAAGLK